MSEALYEGKFQNEPGHPGVFRGKVRMVGLENGQRSGSSESKIDSLKDLSLYVLDLLAGVAEGSHLCEFTQSWRVYFFVFAGHPQTGDSH